MQIINSTPNFTGYYRIPKCADKANDFTQEVMLFYNIVKDNNITALKSNYPYRKVFDGIYDNIAKEEGGSFQWLVQNAKNYGIDIPDVKEDSIIFVTTKKDIADLMKHLKKDFKKIATKFSPIERFKFKILDLLNIGEDADLPLYIKIVKQIASGEQQSIERFQNYFANKNVINLNSFEELIEKLLLEKA